MKLLLVTDHRFLRHDDKVFDTYCFGRSFFDDYLAVFDSVEVCSRLVNVLSLPSGAFRSDSPEISFLPIPDITGLQWILRARSVSRTMLVKAMDNTDAVVVRAPSQLGYWVAKLARRKGKPYMMEIIGDPAQAILHAGKGWHFKFLAWWEMKRLQSLTRDATIASYVSKYHLQARYPVSQRTPTDIISSIRLLDTEIGLPRKYQANVDTFRIVFVASLLPYKRQADLIRAAVLCKDKSIPIELHFAGGGPLRDDLELLARKLNVQDCVIFHGHIVDRRQLLHLLDASNLFVITSASEGLPRAVLEAMARGLPVIGSRAGGIPELVREADLFEVGDIEKLAKTICDLYNNPDQLEMMSNYSIETARQYSATMLSPKRQRLYKILREMAVEKKVVA